MQKKKKKRDISSKGFKYAIAELFAQEAPGYAPANALLSIELRQIMKNGHLAVKRRQNDKITWEREIQQNGTSSTGENPTRRPPLYRLLQHAILSENIQINPYSFHFLLQYFRCINFYMQKKHFLLCV